MSIYDELKTDHDKVKGLLEQIEGASGRTKGKLFRELQVDLTAHARAEEKVFYDRLKKAKDAKGDAMEGYEEHHVVDVLFREMSKLSPSDDQWKAKFSVLKENIQHHIEDEEGDIFDKAKEIIDEEEAEEIGQKFLHEKEKRMARLAA
jgi:hemerythrin superfamily protein